MVDLAAYGTEAGTQKTAVESHGRARGMREPHAMVETRAHEAKVEWMKVETGDPHTKAELETGRPKANQSTQMELTEDELRD